jgi:agmatine/peptidylarginine deiminase
VTNNAVYVPQFGSPLDEEVLALIDENTAKAVVPVPSQDVCFMGGSARCLVWQTADENAAALRRAASLPSR